MAPKRQKQLDKVKTAIGKVKDGEVADEQSWPCFEQW